MPGVMVGKGTTGAQVAGSEAELGKGCLDPGVGFTEPAVGGPAKVISNVVYPMVEEAHANLAILAVDNQIKRSYTRPSTVGLRYNAESASQFASLTAVDPSQHWPGDIKQDLCVLVDTVAHSLSDSGN